LANTARDPVIEYADSVLSGEVPAGRWVRLACQRHLRDLEQAKAKGFVWNAERALAALEFFPDLLFLEEAKPFNLEPFQQFIVGSLFGWYRTNGYRRFRTAYIETGKGTGKSPLAGGVGLYGLIADGEPSAEIYSAATQKEQAAICFRDAKHMVELNPDLAGIIDVGISNLAVRSTNSFFRPVSSEHKGLDGKRVHIALVDELHEHPSALVVDKMRAGTKARRNALLFEITNSGVGRHSVCWQHHDYSTKILQEIFVDDSWFAYVCTLDPCLDCEAAGKDQPNDECEKCDDWRNEKTWGKANPGLGTILPIEYLREQVNEAINRPGKENIVKRLNFCTWTEQSVRWLSMTAWDECNHGPIDPGSLLGRECFGGLDLAKVSDLSAFVLLFPPKEEGEPWKVLCWFWVPEEDIKDRSERDKVPYDVWVRQKLIITTEGNVTDYTFIQAKIIELAGQYQIKEIAFDRTFGGEIVEGLKSEGLTMVQFGQGFYSMDAPTAELERMIKGRELSHGGHPVLRWNASNIAVSLNPAGSMKPDKVKSTERIDGIVALCNALGRAIVQPIDPGSVYNDPNARPGGLLSVGESVAAPVPVAAPTQEKQAEQQPKPREFNMFADEDDEW
jgi:phage terminase large subunit-like protein